MKVMIMKLHGKKKCCSHFSLDVIGYSQKKCALFVIVYEPAFDRIDKKAIGVSIGGAHTCAGKAH